MQWQLISELAVIPILIRGFEIRQLVDESVMRGGLTVSPDIHLTETSSGYLFYDQLCLHHSLKIKTASQKYEFVTNGDPHRDTPNDASSHVNLYFVRKNEIEDAGYQPTEPFFLDCPFLFLPANFLQVDYNISFETWLQYGQTLQPQLPMLKFRWWLHGVVINTRGVWSIDHARHSSAEEIRGSVQLFDRDAKPLNVNDYPSLKAAVRIFFQSGEELRWLLESST